MSKTETQPDGSDSSIDPQPLPESELDDRPVIRYRSLSSFKQACLRFVAKLDRPNGIDIKEELEEYYDEEIHHGRLYPNLDDIVEQGFVEKGARNDRSNFYALTEIGERVLREEVAGDYETVVGDQPGDGDGEP